MIAASSWSADRLPTWQASSNLGRRIRAAFAPMLRRAGIQYGIRDKCSLSTQFFIAKCIPEMSEVFALLQADNQDWLEPNLYKPVIARFGSRVIVGMPEREPTHPQFRNACDDLSLISHHWPSVADAPSNAFVAGEPVINKK